MLINKEWKEITSYVYDNSMIKSVLLDKINLLNEHLDKIDHFVIHKGWIYGSHVKMIYTLKKDVNPSFDVVFRSEVESTLEKYRDVPIEIDFQKKENIYKRIALLENFQGTFLPLRPHLSVYSQDFDIQSIQTIYDKEIYLMIEELKSRFISSMYQDYYSYSEEEKDIFLVKLMVIMTDVKDPTNHSSEIGNDEIKYRYLTFRSHYEGFVAQLKANDTPANQKIREELHRDSKEMIHFIDQEFPLFLNSFRENLVGYEERDKKYLVDWSHVVQSFLKIYAEALETGKVEMNEFQGIDRFLDHNKEHLSEFHKRIFSDQEFKEFFGSFAILKHRFSINSFYSLLPILSVSPLRKHKLCKNVAKGVEGYYKINYSDIIDELITDIS